jgi:dihydroorotase
MRITDAQGKIRPEIRDLKDRGLILDIGHGTGSFSYEVAEAMLDQGLPPDVISSDIHQLARQGPMFDLPTTLSKFLNLGMSLSDVIERATSAPASAMRRSDLGTLTVGSAADVALFRLEEGEFDFYDSDMARRGGKSRLVSTMTMVDGQVLVGGPERDPHVWAVLPERQRPILELGRDA